MAQPKSCKIIADDNSFEEIDHYDSKINKTEKCHKKPPRIYTAGRDDIILGIIGCAASHFTAQYFYSISLLEFLVVFLKPEVLDIKYNSILCDLGLLTWTAAAFLIYGVTALTKLKVKAYILKVFLSFCEVLLIFLLPVASLVTWPHYYFNGGIPLSFKLTFGLFVFTFYLIFWWRIFIDC